MDIKAALTKKIGPVPVVLVIAGAAAAFMLLGRRGAQGGDSFIATGNAGGDGNDPLSNVTDSLGNIAPYDPILGAGNPPIFLGPPDNPPNFFDPSRGSVANPVVWGETNRGTSTTSKPGKTVDASPYDSSINAWTGHADPGLPKGFGYQRGGRYIAAIDPATGLPIQTPPDFIDYGVATIPGAPGLTQGLTIEDWFIQSNTALGTDAFKAQAEAESARVGTGQDATGVGPGGKLIYGPTEAELMANINKSRDVISVPTAAEAASGIAASGGTLKTYEPTYVPEYHQPSTADTTTVSTTTTTVEPTAQPYVAQYIPPPRPAYVPPTPSPTVTPSGPISWASWWTGRDTTPVEGPRDTGRPATPTPAPVYDTYVNRPYQGVLDAPVDY